MLHINHLRQLMSGQSSTAQTAMATNLLQLLVHQAPNQNNVHNARAYFSQQGKRDIGGRLGLWGGFFQSARPVFDKIIVNVDTVMATVLSALTGLVLMASARRTREL
ncbi:hypothetical protein VKT23_004088 [Stygiomarasmius scandens]|uniref:Argonaute linker 1 domain-containing protein n=1 Tax=Marasmiellus scandens TaxID=2682957 RepID=A0ABR1JT81_9AGAR